MKIDDLPKRPCVVGRCAVAAALAITIVLPAATARADAPAPMTPDDASGRTAQTATVRRWYGWQNLLIDGGSLVLLGVDGALIAASAKGDATFSAGSYVAIFAPGVVGSLGYLFGGPIVHWAHGRTGTGFASLGLRIVAPLAGLGGGALIQGVAGHDNTAGGAIGAGLGALVAMAIDDALLAHETVEHGASASTSSASVRTAAAFRLAPTWNAKQHAAGLQLLGSF